MVSKMVVEIFIQIQGLCYATGVAGVYTLFTSYNWLTDVSLR